MMLLSSGIVSAYDGGGVQYQHALDFLKAYGIVTEEQQWGFAGWGCSTAGLMKWETV